MCGHDKKRVVGEEVDCVGGKTHREKNRAANNNNGPMSHNYYDRKQHEEKTQTGN